MPTWKADNGVFVREIANKKKNKSKRKTEKKM